MPKEIKNKAPALSWSSKLIEKRSFQQLGGCSLHISATRHVL